MFREVPVLPVVVPLAVVVLGLLLAFLHRRDRLTVPGAAVALAASVLVAGIVANTVFPVYLDKPAREADWHTSLVLVPFRRYELADAVANVAVFVPVGVLAALVLGAGATWWRVLALGAGVSLSIEVTQYATAHLLGAGHVADASDLVCNAGGALLGHALLRLARRVPAVAALGR